ncbi:AzlD domain-containing protein [Serratia sp. UGAL515B_01]|uniref:AzlD domain-containing protein n=1 Tax=Serratia sp. UGAL515B_01 TaxID=2986763 RepID=UPI0029530DB3|nr:AzlD domain-containing protein [Serratia sp. UGAL515B_01]WON78071.1 AzlD domain-containing protein [Serratia sp. UGAL515B_01]
MIWLTIVLMGAIVFFNRYCFLAPKLPVRLSPRIRTLLSFSVPAVLTAICGPIIAFSADEWRPVAENPYLFGALFAIVLAFFLRNMLAVVVLSMLMFILMRVVL